MDMNLEAIVQTEWAKFKRWITPERIRQLGIAYGYSGKELLAWCAFCTTEIPNDPFWGMLEIRNKFEGLPPLYGAPEIPGGHLRN